jgi:hypothetical protein
LPSALKSPTATDVGLEPVLMPAGAWKVPSPLPSRTLTSPALAVARSMLPSPLKSPAPSDWGLLPVAEVRGAAKVPSPVPRSTLTVLSPVFVTARSGKGSLLKCPETIAWEGAPAG